MLLAFTLATTVLTSCVAWHHHGDGREHRDDGDHRDHDGDHGDRH